MPMFFTTNQREKYVRRIMDEGGVTNRQKKAPDIIQELIKNTNLDTNTINDMVKSYVQGDTMQLPSMLSSNTQGPLNQNQVRETPTNSIRPPVYTTEKGSGVFRPAEPGIHDPNQIKELSTEPTQGVTTLYSRGANGYQVVGTQPSKTDRWVDVTPSNERGYGRNVGVSRGAQDPQTKADLSVIEIYRRSLVPKYGAGGVAIPAQVDPELEAQAIDAAQRIGLPLHVETTPGTPRGWFRKGTPESKRIVIGNSPVDPETFGNGQQPERNGAAEGHPVQPRKQEAARSFKTEAEAEAARLPKGTIIMINGRRARIR